MQRLSDPTPRSLALKRAAWAFVFYLIGVILFGAWVRITHSGAGCGSHWPTCHGALIPLAPTLETKIEFTHRLTSGLCGIFSLALIAALVRRFGRAHRAIKAALVTLAFIILEGAIGAGIVLKELVGSDDSGARAIIISLHLVNTLALVSSAALTAWWSGGAPPLQLKGYGAAPLWLRLGWLCGLVALVATSMTGAITALGDTLFPIAPALGPGLLDKVRDDLSATSHFLVRLRVAHPVVAILSATYLMGLGNHIWQRARAPHAAKRWALIVVACVAAQVLIGLANIALAAPGWMQLVHLLMANLVWLGVWQMGCELLAMRPSATSERAS